MKTILFLLALFAIGCYDQDMAPETGVKTYQSGYVHTDAMFPACSVAIGTPAYCAKTSDDDGAIWCFADGTVQEPCRIDDMLAIVVQRCELCMEIWAVIP
jgi:hypothetical protein